METIKNPFTPEQVESLNKYQNEGRCHPFTCRFDGDQKHIMYEFHKDCPDGNYEEYIAEQKELGVPFPEMAFNSTI